MEISILTAYVVSVFFLVASPGPVLANTIDSSVRNGTRSGLFSIVGSNLASLVLISCAIFILTGVISLSKSYLYWMSLFGCLFIAYISIQGLYEQLSPPNDETLNLIKNTKSINNSTNLKSLRRGFIISISNPKDILFFISFFPQFINVTENFYYSTGILTTTWIILDISILSFYVLAMKKDFAQKNKKLISIISNMLLFIISIIGAYITLF